MSKTRYSISAIPTNPAELVRYMQFGIDAWDMHNPFWKCVIARLCQFIKAELQNSDKTIELCLQMQDGLDYAFCEAAILAKRHYNSRVKLAVISDKHSNTKMTKTNRIIMDNADCITFANKRADLTIALWDKRTYGNTFKYIKNAKMHGQALWIIDPRDIAAAQYA